MKAARYVYVAGPLTKGDPFVNVHAAIVAGEQLRAAGFAPYVPHEHVLWQMATGSLDYEGAMALDLAWVERCDVLVRLPGESSGADREVEHARAHGIPVYFGVDVLMAARPAIAIEARATR